MEVDVGRIIAGKYKLVKLIGQGGMGDVWRARHVGLGEHVGLKLLKVRAADAETPARARFDLEAKVSARLSRRSRHVVSVIDQGEEDGNPFLVMELLEGESMEDQLQRTSILPFPTTAPIVSHVARALVCSHAEGVVHRDLKPSNIFLTKDEDGRLFVKVLDFGIARVLEPRVETGEIRAVRHTQRGMVIGTPAYMSPEQVKAVRNLGPECDVWALAAIAYEAIAGQPPFVGEMKEAFERLIAGEAPPVTSLRPDAPPALDAVFARAFQRKKDDRFPSAHALAEALVRALGDAGSQPDVPVTRTPTASQLIPMSRRTWVVPVVGAVLLTMLIVGVMIFTRAPERGRATAPPLAPPPDTTPTLVPALTQVEPTSKFPVALPVTALPKTQKTPPVSAASTARPAASVIPTPSLATPAASIDKGAIF